MCAMNYVYNTTGGKYHCTHSTDTFPMDPIMQQVLRVVCADNSQHRNGKYTGIVRVGRVGEAPNAIQPTASTRIV